MFKSSENNGAPTQLTLDFRNLLMFNETNMKIKLQTDLRAIGPEAKLRWELKEKYPFDFGPTLAKCEVKPISR